MAGTELLDGNLTVLGNATVSALTVSNLLTATGGLSIPAGQGVLSNSVATTATVSSQGANSVTINARAGKITTATLSTAANSVFTMTLTNSTISAGDMVFWDVVNGTNTAAGLLRSATTTVINGSAVWTCQTLTNALNGTLVFNFNVVK